MARKIYRIDEFIGIDQSVGENGMSPAYSPDACNMDMYPNLSLTVRMQTATVILIFVERVGYTSL